MEKLGIYVHIPYCIKKCNYCDFVSFPLEKCEEDPDEYSNIICKEIVEKSIKFNDRFEVDSIYFGGGTPSCIPVDSLIRILLCIKKNFTVLPDAEISMEANPDTVTQNKAKIWKSYGFNRISMGVQSFDDNVLAIMGRVHNAKKAREAYGILRSVGFDNINLDLMFGVPGQDFDIWKKTLDELINLSPEHVSFYSLQLEEGTNFYKAYRNGDIDLPAWEENRRMYRYAVDTLKKHNYHHYEISNAARPGYECRHNLKYWTMKPYLGFGTSAHSFIDGKRTDDDNPDLETDKIFTGLRLIEGTDFGKEFCLKYKKIIDELVSENFIFVEGTCIRLTDKGLDNTNPVMGRFLNG